MRIKFYLFLVSIMVIVVAILNALSTCKIMFATEINRNLYRLLFLPTAHFSIDFISQQCLHTLSDVLVYNVSLSDCIESPISPVGIKIETVRKIGQHQTLRNVNQIGV